MARLRTRRPTAADGKPLGGQSWRDVVPDDADLDALAERLHRGCRWMRDGYRPPPLPEGTPEERLDAIDGYLVGRGIEVRRWVWSLITGKVD